MKQMFVVSCVLAVALVACGGKNKSATTPTSTQKTEMKSDGSTTGGATYGTAKPMKTPEGGGTEDPCAAH